MYIILVYDVNTKRVNKVLKICRKYLTRVQNSVFEGYISSNNFQRLKKELRTKIHPKEDFIRIYTFPPKMRIKKENIGVFENKDNFI